MIIGIDASRALRPQKTGTEWYSHELIQGLSRLDLVDQIRLYGAISRKKLGFVLPALMQYRHLHWPLKRLWTQGRLSWEMLRMPPDVLFVPSHVIPVIHPKNTVTTLHDVGFLHWQKAYTQKEWQYLDWSTRFALRKCPKVITISQFSKDEIVRAYNADPDMIEVIYLGYDTTRYALPSSREIVRSEVSRRHHIEGPYILMIGRLDLRKNQSFLIRAFEQIAAERPELKLVLVGPLGYGGQEIVRQIEASPFKERIVRLGWLAEEEKIQILQGASALVFPSLYEGFGLPIIEAQACGVPVIAANTSCIPEIAGESAALFNPEEMEECVTSITQVMDDAVFREQLIGRGLENVTRFSWDECARQTLELLRRVGGGESR